MRLEEKLEKINIYRPLTPAEIIRLNEDFCVSYTYNSNAIEGSSLTLRETAFVLNEGITIANKPLKDHFAAIGHKEAFYYLLELVKEKQPITERIIKELHSLVLMDQVRDRGKYRSQPVTVGGTFTPVEFLHIEECMKKLVLTYNNSASENFIDNLAKFHLEFESIHPFIDGNGRTGRLLVNLELMKRDFPPIDIKYTDRIRYYDAFDEYHHTGSVKAMSELFSEYLNQRLDRYLEVLEQRDRMLETKGDDSDSGSTNAGTAHTNKTERIVSLPVGNSSCSKINFRQE